MSITLTPRTEQRIRHWIDNSRYPDAETVIATATAVTTPITVVSLQIGLFTIGVSFLPPAPDRPGMCSSQTL